MNKQLCTQKTVQFVETLVIGVALLLGSSLHATAQATVTSALEAENGKANQAGSAAAESPAREGNRCHRSICKTDESDEPVSIKKVFLNLPGDQKTIWTSPFHITGRDFASVLPISGATGLLFATDRRNMLREHSNAKAISLSYNIANAGTIGLAAAPAGMYLWGKLNADGRLKETGLLDGEAMINSLIVSEALNRILGRERPTATDGTGRFFQNFGNSSFPSDHAIIAWSSASVIAHEYPGWLSEAMAYGTATAVSFSRVTGRKHFPSDVVTGSALGWLIGRQIYTSHHDSALDDADYGQFDPRAGHFQGKQTGAVYVPLDSWVYAAFDRLQALGYAPSAVSGRRRGTRAECARLVHGVEQRADRNSGGPAANLLRDLEAEFAVELQEQPPTEPNAYMEEMYARAGGLGGQPLADDFHFGKTFIDDFGRPFGNGLNAVVGLSSRSVAGSLGFYVRGEYQHAGTLVPETASIQQAIASFEGLPFAPAQRTDSLDRLRFLDTYVSFNFHDNVISFGKQSLWWGPGADGPFLASNNAEPLTMLRISRATPFELPSVFRLMGPIRVEAFWGQLGGQQFVQIVDAAGKHQIISAPLQPHPWVQGAKFSLKTTSNLEFGFDVSSVFGGPGFPFTLHTLLRSYSPSNALPGAQGDPGDRRSAFDFSYRLPGFRNWLTLYVDSFTEDEFSPISFPRKSSFRAGLYMPQIPSLRQLDLRVEGIYTDIPSIGLAGVEYINSHYLSGYTNYGQIIGNAIGREGRGINAWTTYHFSGARYLQWHYRYQHVNPEFLQGGQLRDFDMNGSVLTARNIAIGAAIKYEHCAFPLLSSTPKPNASGVIQISLRPPHGLSLFSRH